MFRKPTDLTFSELSGGADFTTNGIYFTFHSAVLLLAAFEGAERREIGDIAEQERLYHNIEKSRRER
jgi:hypothetical protein